MGVQYLMLLLKFTPHISTFALGPSESLAAYSEQAIPIPRPTPGKDGANGSMAPNARKHSKPRWN